MKKILILFIITFHLYSSTYAVIPECISVTDSVFLSIAALGCVSVVGGCFTAKYDQKNYPPLISNDAENAELHAHHQRYSKYYIPIRLLYYGGFATIIIGYAGFFTATHCFNKG